MLRTLLIATALLTTSGAALARDSHDYGRVISVEPSFSVSFGTRHHDGYRVQYESGGQDYWAHSSRPPGQYFVLPPQHYVQSNYGYRDYGYRDHGRKVHREDRRDNRREDRRYDRH